MVLVAAGGWAAVCLFSALLLAGCVRVALFTTSSSPSSSSCPRFSRAEEMIDLSPSPGRVVVFWPNHLHPASTQTRRTKRPVGPPSSYLSPRPAKSSSQIPFPAAAVSRRPPPDASSSPHSTLARSEKEKRCLFGQGFGIFFSPVLLPCCCWDKSLNVLPLLSPLFSPSSYNNY